MKLDFEKLFCKALNEAVDTNGGSLYDALYEFGIDYNSEEGQAIIKWYGPDYYEDEEDEEEDNEDYEEENDEEEIKQLKYLLNKERCCSLDRDEMYELQELLNKYGYPSY